MIQQQHFSFHLVVEEDKYTEGSQARGCKRVKGLEEENELQILRDLLKVQANGWDGDELGDVEDKGEDEHRHQVTDNCLLQVRSSLLG